MMLVERPCLRINSSNRVRYALFLATISFLMTTCSANSITVEPSGELTTRIGEDVTLKATFDEPPLEPEKIGWSVHGLRLIRENSNLDRFEYAYDANSRTASLTIKNIRLNDDGYFMCQYTTTDATRAQSDKIKLTVLVPPKDISITGGSEQKLIEDKDTDITCVVTGSNPPVTIAWLKNGEPATETISQQSEEQSGEAAKTFITTGVITVKASAADTGTEYTCKATGNMITASSPQQSTTKINVQYVPKLSMTPDADSSFNADSAATFTCSGNANPAVDSWKWFLDDQELAGATSASYTFSPITSEHNSKKLKCQGTNSVGSGEVTQTLNVYYAPSFEVKGSDVHADVGDAVTLTCVAKGNPAPSITWLKVDSSRILATSNEYQIKSVQKDDFGAYECKANVLGFQNAVHKLHILEKAPPMIKGATEFSFSQGDTANLSCIATCVPTYTEIIWRKVQTGEVIRPLPSSRFSEVREDLVDGVKSFLFIKDMASNDFDEYNCTIVNDRGSDSVLVKVTQKDDFPWVIVVAVGAAVVILAGIIAIAVCCCRRRKANSGSAGSSGDQYWLDGKPYASESSYLQFYPNNRRSLSVVSHSTDNSVKKPAVDIERTESPSLPTYSLRPVDTWKTQHNGLEPIGYDGVDFPKPELYGGDTYRAKPTNLFYNNEYSNSTANYGTYNVNRNRLNPAVNTFTPQYSTLPLRPTMLPPEQYDRYSYGYGADDFPEPPLEARLATNV